MKSRSNIHRIIHSLEKQGLLVTTPHKVRTMKLKDRSVEEMLAL
jgi:DNA-binding MarR family transcriptional regulator